MENNYLKVEGHSHLVRDVRTNAIINTNVKDHQAYISLRNAKNVENCRINNIENDLNNLKSDINEIKSLLRKLANEP